MAGAEDIPFKRCLRWFVSIGNHIATYSKHVFLLRFEGRRFDVAMDLGGLQNGQCHKPPYRNLQKLNLRNTFRMVATFGLCGDGVCFFGTC